MNKINNAIIYALKRYIIKSTSINNIKEKEAIFLLQAYKIN